MDKNEGKNKSKKKNKMIKKLLSSLLAFFLSVFLTAGTVCIAIYLGYFTENKVLDSLNAKDYYTDVEEFFIEDAKDLTLPSGLPVEIVEGMVDSNTVHDDVRGYVKASFRQEEYIFATDKLKKNLTENVNFYFAESGTEMTQLQKDTLPEYVQSVADLYEEDLKVPLVDKIPAIRNVFLKVMIVVLAVSALLGMGIIITLIRMQRWKHRGMRYIVYSTLATAGMTALPAIVAFTSGFYKKINISARHTYYALTGYIENGFLIFLYAAVFWLIASAGLLAGISFMKNRKK